MSVERMNGVVDSAFRDKLRSCGSNDKTVPCSSSGTTREFMSNESCLLDFLAAARNGSGSLQKKPVGSVFVNTNVASWEQLDVAKISTLFWSNVPRWMQKTSQKIWETRDQMIGSKPGDQKELSFLNRTLRWCKNGLVFAANLKHDREVVDELGLSKVEASFVSGYGRQCYLMPR